MKVLCGNRGNQKLPSIFLRRGGMPKEEVNYTGWTNRADFNRHDYLYGGGYDT